MSCFKLDLTSQLQRRGQDAAAATPHLNTATPQLESLRSEAAGAGRSPKGKVNTDRKTGGEGKRARQSSTGRGVEAGGDEAAGGVKRKVQNGEEKAAVSRAGPCHCQEN